MRDALMLSSLASLLVVTLAILIALSSGLRRHRIGVTLLASWCSAGVSIYSLRMLGDAISPDLYFAWYGPVGTWLAAWALWDVSRLSRHYGTSTLTQAADIARGFLLSERAADAVWAQWARHLPTSAWVKGPDGVMVAINRHLESRYDVHESQYVGTSDAKFFGDLGSVYLQADQQVFEVGAPLVTKDPAPVLGDPHRHAIVLRFPIRGARGVIVGVGGIEMLIDDSCGKARGCIQRGHGIKPDDQKEAAA